MKNQKMKNVVGLVLEDRKGRKIVVVKDANYNPCDVICIDKAVATPYNCGYDEDETVREFVKKFGEFFVKVIEDEKEIHAEIKEALAGEIDFEE